MSNEEKDIIIEKLKKELNVAVTERESLRRYVDELQAINYRAAGVLQEWIDKFKNLKTGYIELSKTFLQVKPESFDYHMLLRVDWNSGIDRETVLKAFDYQLEELAKKHEQKKRMS